MSIIKKSYDYTYAPQVKSLIDMTLSENPLGCSKKIRKAILKECGNIHSYPYNGEVLINLLAIYHNIKPDNIMLGAGANQLLEDVLKVYAIGRGIVVPAATFPESIACITTLNGYAKTVPLNSDFTINLKWMLDAVSEDISLIHICNPNNPTGIAINIDGLYRAAKSCSVPILVSEAGADYIGASIIDKGLHHNIIVVRSFSKSYGLAGLRIGYVVAESPTIRNLKKSLGSYRANALGAAAAVAALEDQAHLQRSIHYVMREKAWLMNKMHNLGFSVVPSQGQTFIARIPEKWSDVESFCNAIRKCGAAVLDCSIYEGLERYIRISPQLYKTNRKFISILSTQLS